MNIIEDLVGQIHKWPASVVLVVALSFGGIVLKRMALFPNRFIPATLMVLATLLYPLVGDWGAVDPHIPHPQVILCLYGWIHGVIAWLTQGLIWNTLVKRIPGIENGDTKFIKRDKDQT